METTGLLVIIRENNKIKSAGKTAMPEIQINDDIYNVKSIYRRVR